MSPVDALKAELAARRAEQRSTADLLKLIGAPAFSLTPVSGPR